MVQQGARHLVLLGRTPLPPRRQWPIDGEAGSLAKKISAVRELEAQGARIHLAACDVADEEQLISSLEECYRAGCPSIRGVVHAAGVFLAKPLAQLEAGELLSVFRPKLIGGWLLHKLLKDADLDFFVLFSSVSSVL